MSFIDTILGRQQTPQTIAPAAVAPAAPKQPDTPVEPVNPLDSYKAMLENANKADETAPPQFSLDNEVLNTVTGKLNFTAGVNAELVGKATNGDAQAMIELMNAVGQNAYKAALQHGTALTDTHLTNRGKWENTNVNSQVKQSLITQELSAVPSFDHPVVKAEMVRIAQNLAKQSPDATPAQIKEETVKYFNAVYSAVSPQPKQQPSQTAGDVQDWEAFLTS